MSIYQTCGSCKSIANYFCGCGEHFCRAHCQQHYSFHQNVQFQPASIELSPEQYAQLEFFRSEATRLLAVYTEEVRRDTNAAVLQLKVQIGQIRSQEQVKVQARIEYVKKLCEISEQLQQHCQLPLNTREPCLQKLKTLSRWDNHQLSGLLSEEILGRPLHGFGRPLEMHTLGGLQRSLALPATLFGHDGPVWSLDFTADKLVSGAQDGLVNVWDCCTGLLEASFNGHKNAVRAISAKRGIVVSASKDKSVRVWDIATGTCVNKVSRAGNCLFAVAFNGTELIWGSPRLLKGEIVAAAGTAEAVSVKLKGIRALDFTEKLIAFGCESDVLFSYWSANRTVELIKFDAPQPCGSSHSREVYSVAIQDHLVASGSKDCTVKVWNTEDRVLVMTLDHQKSVYKVLFHQNLLVSASADGVVCFWQHRTGELLRKCAEYTTALTSMTFNGRLLAIGAEDGKIILDAPFD